MLYVRTPEKVCQKCLLVADPITNLGAALKSWSRAAWIILVAKNVPISKRINFLWLSVGERIWQCQGPALYARPYPPPCPTSSPVVNLRLLSF